MKIKETDLAGTLDDVGGGSPLVNLLVILLLAMFGPAVAVGSLEGFNAGASETGKRVARSGENVDIRFTCRLPSGEVAASTEKVKEGTPVSKVFVMREADGPLSVKARPSDNPTGFRAGVSLEDAIEGSLAPLLTGMEEGETRTVTLKAGEASGADIHKYVLRMSRVRVRRKTLRISKDDFRARTRRTPEVGQSFTMDPSFPGRVEAVTEKDVVIRFKARSLEPVETAFGRGTISEDANGYYVNIDVHRGELVRTASMVGRVTEVNDQVFIVDYRNPFGGETLTCDVTVEKVVREKLAALIKSINR